MSTANIPRKRARLSLACNQCRARKVRCDERLPSCTRCLQAGISCFTTNPRKPDEQGASQLRRRAGTAPNEQASDSPIASEPEQNGEKQHNPTTGTRPNGVSNLPYPKSTFSGSAATGQTSARDSFDQVQDESDDHVSAPDNRSPAFALNTAGPEEQKWLGPSSLQVFTHWLEMTFHTPDQGLADRFQYGMRFAEELELPATVYMPVMPPDWQILVDAFFSATTPLFPIVDRKVLMSQAQHMVANDVAGLPIRERPAIAAVYACLAIGAQQAHKIELAHRLLSATSSLYAYMVAFPYLQSAQTLLLLVLGLRARNKDGAGAQALAQAIRILHSTGVHKQASSLPGPKVPIPDMPQRISSEGLPQTSRPTASLSLSRRIWWAAYCLERMMSFESGRPSHIQDEDTDMTELGDLEQAGCVTDQSFCLLSAARLAKLQGQVSSSLFSRRLQAPSPGEILGIAARLDEALVQWYDHLHIDLRSNTEVLSCTEKHSMIQYFLTMQYHSTLATVHRAALLMDRKIHVANVERSGLSHRNVTRLRSSEAICAASARNIIAAFLEAKDSDCFSPLNTMTPPLLAIYILAIHTIRNPASWKARIDLNTVHVAAEAAEMRYREEGQDYRFYGMLSVLKQFASQDCLAPLKKASTALEPKVPTANTLQQHATSILARSDSDRASVSGLKAGADLSHSLDDWLTLYPQLYMGDMQIDQGPTLSDADLTDLMGIPHLTDEELMSFTLPTDH